MSWSRTTVIGIAGVGSLVIAGGLFLFYLLSRDTTSYAPGFSEQRFSRITVGMKIEEVDSILGQPLSSEAVEPGEVWIFGEPERAEGGRGTGLEYQLFGVPVVHFDLNEKVVKSFGTDLIRPGMSKEEVVSLLGDPAKVHLSRDTLRLYYSWPNTYGRYEARIIGVDGAGLVTAVYRYTTYE